MLVFSISYIYRGVAELMPLAAWLLALVPSLVARVLASLGFGLVSVVGIDFLSTKLLDFVLVAVGGFPSSIASLMGLAGVGVGLNIIVGAITARVALYVLMRTARIIGL